MLIAMSVNSGRVPGEGEREGLLPGIQDEHDGGVRGEDVRV
jgi:hypothetical protein